MISRREVLASGAALSVLTQTSAAGVGTLRGQNGNTIFIADRDVAESRIAAAAATTSGAEAVEFMSDVTPAYDKLDVRLRESPKFVAGLATPQALFALERLAWDRGLRTIYRGIHRTARARYVSHQLSGSGAFMERINTPAARDFAARLGHELVAATQAPVEASAIITSQWLPARDDDVLVSWLFAPRGQFTAGRSHAALRS